MTQVPAIRRVACVGAGVIGAGWVARLLWNGIDVAVADPDPEAPRKLQAVLDNADRALSALFGGPPARRGALSFAPDIAAAVAEAGLVQESAPEREEAKLAVLAEADAAAPDGALICTSTSGLLPSRLQRGLTRPGRFLVAHPFNPVYLLPLVELCAGAQTDPAAVDRAEAFYTGIGMQPLRVRKEIDGFIANRLLEALWLVHDDVATVAEVDDAVRYGAGLRWALMGSFLNYRIAGGEEGMHHFMAQFDPALAWPWSKLVDVPQLTPQFLDRIAAQSDDQAAGRDLRALERLRDDGLVALLKSLQQTGIGAGATLAAYSRGVGAGDTDPVDGS